MVNTTIKIEQVFKLLEKLVSDVQYAGCEDCCTVSSKIINEIKELIDQYDEETRG